VSKPVTVLDCVLLKDRNLALAPGQGPEINSQACLWVSPRPRHHIQCWLTNHRLILLRVSCLETPKASSSPTNFRTEPSLVSLLAISLTRTPAYWNVYYTIPHNTHHTLYLDEIPSYHLRTRRLFICVLYKFFIYVRQTQPLYYNYLKPGCQSSMTTCFGHSSTILRSIRAIICTILPCNGRFI
jgi:hypothetical protein